MQEMDYEFLKSRGGVYRTFLESLSSINRTHIDLFSRFGASVVCSPDEEEPFHPKVPVEVNNDQFYDHSLEWGTYSTGKNVVMEQRGRKVIFLGREMRLTQEMKVMFGDHDKTDEFLDFMKQQQIAYGFFCRHEGHALLEVKSLRFLNRIRARFFSGQ